MRRPSKLTRAAHHSAATACIAVRSSAAASALGILSVSALAFSCGGSKGSPGSGGGTTGSNATSSSSSGTGGGPNAESVLQRNKHVNRDEIRFILLEGGDQIMPEIDPKLAAYGTGVLRQRRGADIDLEDVTYYVGHETVVPREDGRGLPKWLVAMFAGMGRNAARISDVLRLPHDHVVEIGREIEI